VGDGDPLGIHLEAQGFDFFAGVPCSLLAGVLGHLERHPRLPYVAAVREDVAVGLAAGAWFGGRRPALLMQNSGLGTALNALASLSLLYELPSLLVVSWRGYGGQDAPEHRLMGAITLDLLRLLDIEARVLSAASLEADVAWARAQMDERPRPVALLVVPGVLGAERAGTPGAAARAEAPAPPAWEAPAAPPLAPRISRREAIAAALAAVGDACVVCANGYPSREACAVADRERTFYMIGSMGLAAPIGLGLALARPDRSVVVFDGDGNLLMSLGVLSNVATLAPPRFVHVVFDNGVYGSTGNQQSPAGQLRLDRVAAAVGYRTTTAVVEATAVSAAVRQALATPGPHFVLVKVTTEQPPVGRIPHPPRVLRDRFRGAVLAP
jgi:phosphonopyruvate decarboxylase